MSDRPIPPDMLDEATAALRGVPIPDGPPAELVAATLAALQNHTGGAVPAGRTRRRRIMRYVGYGTATAAAIGLATLAGVLWLGGTSAEAQVRKALDNAAQAKSVRLVFTRESEGKSQPMMTVHIQNGRSRWEGRKKNEAFTWVIDTNARQGLVLNHVDKTAQRETLASESLDNAVKQHEVFFDPLKVMRETKEMTVKELDGEKLDGRRMKVFLVTHPGNDEHTAMTAILWIDEKSELPARLKLVGDAVDSESPQRPFPKVDTVIVFEDWNKEFDPKLFNLDVPEGYKLTEEPDGPALFTRFLLPAIHNAEKAKSVKVTATIENNGQKTHLRTLYRQGDLIRMETLQDAEYGDDLPVIVADLKTRESLLLYPKAKTAQRTTVGEQEAKLITGMLGDFAQIKAGLADGDEKAVKSLGDEKIGDRTARVYEVTAKGRLAGVWKVWIDPKTDLPVRLRLGDPQAKASFTLDFEDWNKEFDPKLFKREIPEGYKQIKPPGSEEGPTVFTRFLLPAINNAEKAKSVKVIATIENDGKVTFVRTLYRQGDLIRMETVRDAEHADNDSIIIADLKTRDALLLHPNAKTAQRMTIGVQEVKLINGVMDGLSGMKEQLAEGDDKAVKDLGEEKLGDRKVRVYEVTGKKPPGVWKVWIDPKTELPVRVRLADDKTKNAFTLDFHDWNKELDAKLFKREVPEGYKLLKPPGSEEGPTVFGEFIQPAIEKAKKAESVVYTETVVQKGSPPDEMTTRNYIQGGRARVEWPSGGVVVIADGTALFLDTTNETYQFLARGEKRRDKGAQELLAMFLKIKDENAKDFGEEKVGDVTARKYEMKVGKHGEPGSGTCTLWIDPKTGYPVKVHFVHWHGDYTITFGNFTWNEKLDPKLFSVDPPVGYTPAKD